MEVKSSWLPGTDVLPSGQVPRLHTCPQLTFLYTATSELLGALRIRLARCCAQSWMAGRV